MAFVSSSCSPQPSVAPSRLTTNPGPVSRKATVPQRASRRRTRAMRSGRPCGSSRCHITRTSARARSRAGGRTGAQEGVAPRCAQVPQRQEPRHRGAVPRELEAGTPWDCSGNVLDLFWKPSAFKSARYCDQRFTEAKDAYHLVLRSVQAAEDERTVRPGFPLRPRLVERGAFPWRKPEQIVGNRKKASSAAAFRESSVVASCSAFEPFLLLRCMQSPTRPLPVFVRVRLFAWRLDVRLFVRLFVRSLSFRIGASPARRPTRSPECEINAELINVIQESESY